MNILSFSGGIDSSALLFRMLELKWPLDCVVFADTTLEFPETYKYIERVKNIVLDRGLLFKVVGSIKTFDEWFYGRLTRGKLKGRVRGFPLVLYPCWWSRESKLRPLNKFCKGHIRFIGITSDEASRAHEKEGFKYPLVEWGWSHKQCYDYLEKRGLLSTIHKKFKRSGCWLCPKQNKGSLRILKRNYPEYWVKLLKYEVDSPHPLKPNFKLNSI